jgi:hypothetical protein
LKVFDILGGSEKTEFEFGNFEIFGLDLRFEVVDFVGIIFVFMICMSEVSLELLNGVIQLRNVLHAGVRDVAHGVNNFIMIEIMIKAG